MTDSVKALDAALADTEPLTEEQVDRSLRLVQRRAWEASQEYRELTRRLAEAENAAAKAYLTAHSESYALHPDRKVAQHETIAKLAAHEAEAEAVLARLLERSLRKEMELLGSLTSALQTQKKSFRE